MNRMKDQINTDMLWSCLFLNNRTDSFKCMPSFKCAEYLQRIYKCNRANAKVHRSNTCVYLVCRKNEFGLFNT